MCSIAGRYDAGIGQAPRTFNYQAILRDVNGLIMSNEAVVIKVRIIDAQDAEIYSETHDTTTNELGMVSLMTGEGITSYELSSVDWSKGPYYLEITLNDVLIGSSPLLSVPYALYAEEAANAFSGDYQDLTNLPGIPYKTSELENDAGFITQETDPVFGQSVAKEITIEDTLRWGDNFSGRYEDLEDVPQALHEFEADMGWKALSNVGDPERSGDAVNLKFCIYAMLDLFSTEQLLNAVLGEGLDLRRSTG